MLENIFFNYLNDIMQIDSVSGYYSKIQKYITNKLFEMNIPFDVLRKGGVIAHVHKEPKDKIAILAHADTIGMIVRSINSDGTLNISSIGAISPINEVNWNITIHTLDEREYAGVIYKNNPSIHTNKKNDLLSIQPDECIIVLDNNVNSKEDVELLGINPGDIIAPVPHLKILDNGIIKSRFIDDKGAVAVLLTIIYEFANNKINICKNVDFYFTMFEETGYGASILQTDVKDIIALDAVPVGKGQCSCEDKITLSPYFGGMCNRELTKEIINCAKINSIPYVIDVFQNAGTDCDAAISAGYDIRHAVIGFGTYSTHGYERTSLSSLKSMHDLLCCYLK